MQIVRRSREGFTLIELLIVIAVIAILAAIAIPNLLSSREAANEASAIGSLRTINSVEATYRSRNASYATVDQLAAANLIDPALGAATSATSPKSGYAFLAEGDTSRYVAVGVPVSSTHEREFYTDDSGIIFAAPNATPFTLPPASGIAPTGFSQIGN